MGLPGGMNFDPVKYVNETLELYRRAKNFYLAVFQCKSSI